MTMPCAVLIAGPTASGKSAFALELAEEFGGTIVNADSMQVYRELHILTNRPSPEEEARAPHRLYGFRPAAEPYSTALWLEDIRNALADARQQGLLPIIVGGTGLYFTALTEGLSEIPAIPAAIRDRIREEAAVRPPEALYGELAKRDPLTAARLRPSDPQRIARALEVLEATGRPLAEWQAQRLPPLIAPETAFRIALCPERDELYGRCNERFDAMLAAGAIEETRAILRLNLDRSLPAMRAVGLAPLISYLQGGASLDEAAAQAKTATRNYAKRQLTWIRNNFMSWNIENEKQMKRTKRDLRIFVQNSLTGGSRNVTD